MYSSVSIIWGGCGAWEGKEKGVVEFSVRVREGNDDDDDDEQSVLKAVAIMNTNERQEGEM